MATAADKASDLAKRKCSAVNRAGTCELTDKTPITEPAAVRGIPIHDRVWSKIEAGVHCGSTSVSDKSTALRSNRIFCRKTLFEAPRTRPVLLRPACVD